MTNYCGGIDLASSTPFFNPIIFLLSYLMLHHLGKVIENNGNIGVTGRPRLFQNHLGPPVHTLSVGVLVLSARK